LKDFEGLLEPLLAPDLLGNAIVCSLFGEYVEVEIQKFRSYYIFEKYLGNDLFAPCDARKDVLGTRVMRCCARSGGAPDLYASVGTYIHRYLGSVVAVLRARSRLIKHAYDESVQETTSFVPFSMLAKVCVYNDIQTPGCTIDRTDLERS
jgi:hypothetical protein